MCGLLLGKPNTQAAHGYGLTAIRRFPAAIPLGYASGDFLYHLRGYNMRRLSLLSLILGALLTTWMGSSAFADSGPGCGPGSYYRDFECYPNSYQLTQDACEDFCMNSEFCAPYQDHNKTVFSGFWRISSDWHNDVMQACEAECTVQKKACDASDQNCLARFEPKSIDCLQLTDEEEQAYCNDMCRDSILTSQCGLTCLKNGIEMSGLSGCAGSGYCNNLCNESYCAAIPMEYETKWSVFAVLMTLLTLFCGVVIVFLNKNSAEQTEDKHA